MHIVVSRRFKRMVDVNLDLSSLESVAEGPLGQSWQRQDQQRHCDQQYEGGGSRLRRTRASPASASRFWASLGLLDKAEVCPGVGVEVVRPCLVAEDAVGVTAEEDDPVRFGVIGQVVCS